MIRAESARRPAVFFDRDGVLNPQARGAMRAEALTLLPGAAEAVRLVNAAGWLAVVVTNQPYIARGELSLDELRAVHDKLGALLAREGARLDRIYFCPHHPEKGFAGEVASLKTACTCRKPAAGMVFRAAEDLPIALERSCVIGDSWRDVGLARNAGIPCLGVRTGLACADGPPAPLGPGHTAVPDHLFDDVLGAVRFAVSAPR